MQAVTGQDRWAMWPPVGGVTSKAEGRIEETAAAAGTAVIAETTDGHVGTAQECLGSPRWGCLGYLDFYVGRWESTENAEYWDNKYSPLHEECNPQE